jgi:hypothetical protein
MNNKSQLLDHYKQCIKQYDKVLADIDAGAFKELGPVNEIELCMVEAIEACLQGIESLGTYNEQIN